MSPYYAHLIKSPLYGQELVKILINQESSETVLKLHREVYSNLQNLDQNPDGINFEVKSYPILSTSLTVQLLKKLPVPLSKKVEHFYQNKNSFNNFETLIEKTNSLVQALESLEKEYQNICQTPIILEDELRNESESDSESNSESNSEEPYHSENESVSSFEILELDEREKLLEEVESNVKSNEESNEESNDESTDRIVDLEGRVEPEIDENIEIKKEDAPEKSLFDEMNELISDPKVDLDSCMKFTSKIFSKAFNKDNSNFSKVIDDMLNGPFGNSIKSLINPNNLKNEFKSDLSKADLEDDLKDDLKLDQNGMSMLSPDEIMNLPSTKIYPKNHFETPIVLSKPSFIRASSTELRPESSIRPKSIQPSLTELKLESLSQSSNTLDFSNFRSDFTNSESFITPLNSSNMGVLSVQELKNIGKSEKKTSDDLEQRFEHLLQERNMDPREGSYKQLIDNIYQPHPGPLDYNRHDHHYLHPAPYGDNNDSTSQQVSQDIKQDTYRPLIYSVNPEKEYQICLVKSKLNHHFYVLMAHDISEYMAKSELFPELEFQTVYLIPNKNEVEDLLKIQLKLVGPSLNSNRKLEDVITRIKNFLDIRGNSDIIKIGTDQIKKDQIDRLIVRFINQKCFKTTPYGNYCDKTSVQDLKNAFRNYLDLIDMSLHITITFDKLASWLSKYGYEQDSDGKYKMKLRGIEKFTWNGIIDQRKLSGLESISSESENIRSIMKMSNHEKIMMI